MMIPDISRTRSNCICMLSIFFLCSCISCVQNQREYRAHIDGNPDWKMEEICGSEVCSSMTDLLVGNGTKMRFYFWKLDEGQLIFVFLSFPKTRDNLMFNPAKIKASIFDNELEVKGFKRRDVRRWDLDTLRALWPIQSWVTINDEDEFLIFMDYQGLNKETIKMNLSNALMLDGKVLAVPIVHFRPNPLYKEPEPVWFAR